MLLAGNDLAAFLSCLDHQLLVQGLDGADIDNAGIDTLLLQSLAGLQSLIGHQTGSDDGHIVAIHQHLALADLELVVLFIMEHRHSQTTKAQVNGTVMVISSLDSGTGLHVVGGAHNHHAGDITHQGKVLTALVRSAVLAYGDTAVRSTDLHVQLGIADGVANLLISAAGSKHSKAGGKGHHAHGSGTSGHCHHVALSDTTVDVALGERLAEGTGLGGAGQVGVKHHQIVILLTQLNQGLAIAVAGCDLLHVCHLTSPPLLPAERSAQTGPAQSLRRWWPCRASRRCPP